MGTRLVTNRRRPIFVVGRDSLRRHDLLLPASADAVAAVDAAHRARLECAFREFADPVNLFMDTRLTEDGAIEVRPCPARAGERITMRVLIDSYVAVAAVTTGVAACIG